MITTLHPTLDRYATKRLPQRNTNTKWLLKNFNHLHPTFKVSVVKIPTQIIEAEPKSVLNVCVKYFEAKHFSKSLTGFKSAGNQSYFRTFSQKFIS